MRCVLTQQATSSTSFTPPPFDGSLTIPEIYDFHYKKNANHPLFLYDSDGAVQTVHWGQAVKAIHRAARIVQNVPGLYTQTRLAQDTPVVAILAVIDHLSYFALTAGIMRAGYCAFPISTRNSDVAVANMLQKTGAKYMLVSEDQAMQRIAKSARDIISAGSSAHKVELLPIPSFGQLYAETEEEFVLLPPMVNMNIHDAALILHSSGSTSFPKPIYLRHQSLLQWGTQPYYGEVDICGLVLSSHGLSAFHTMGVVAHSWATITGLALSNFAPKTPPIVPSSDTVYIGAIRTGSNLIFCVPTFLEEWSRIPERISELRTFDAILFGGAPLQKAAGDMLSKQGINLFCVYGTTEIGATSTFLHTRPHSEGWEYFKISPHAKPVFLDEGTKENTFRLVIQECETHTPAVINKQISKINAYDTGDLLIRHTTNPELWKMYGRADDQIVHSNGEKTNPVPLETIINRHSKVASAVVFGRERFQAGVLVEPIPSCAFDPSDYALLAEFRTAIWQSIEEVNRFAPSHSRILKEMILVSHPSKPFLYTAKGTARRQVILNMYEDEIEKGYKAFEESSQGEIPTPKSYSMQECLEFVRATINKVLIAPLRDDDDFFEHGCDSLQVSSIEYSILHALRQLSYVSTEEIPKNFIYTNPTILRLSKYIAAIAAREDPTSPSDAATTGLKEMIALVEKYSSGFPQHHPSSLRPSQEAVLLTGSTGGLGSHMLEALILNDQISRVYALNRKDTRVTSRGKLAAVFQDRGLNAALLDSPKITFLEGDTSQEKFGLDEMYEELRQNVTCIMHIAWRVDFNVALCSMEPLLQGTRRLIDFALSSPFHVPPRLVFASSIGVAKNWTEGFLPEVPLLQPSIPGQTGYPQSKWVGERILTRAAETTELSPIIVRIGQLCGGRNGSWNTAEWVPSLVRSGQLLGCLPRADGCVTWIPIHIAAYALVEMRESNDLFLHLVHPSPVSWTSIVNAMSEALQVPLVSYSQWLSSLEAWESDSRPSCEENPAVRLLDFYRSNAKPLQSSDGEVFDLPRLSTARAVEAAHSLRSTTLQPLSQRDVGLWITYWQKRGFLS